LLPLKNKSLSSAARLGRSAPSWWRRRLRGTEVRGIDHRQSQIRDREPLELGGFDFPIPLQAKKRSTHGSCISAGSDALTRHQRLHLRAVAEGDKHELASGLCAQCAHAAAQPVALSRH